MSGTERLTPLPHLIKSIRHRNWGLGGALKEWVDNSLQHGHAKNITIVIDNSAGIGIVDGGIGIDDINRVFTLGDASAYGEPSTSVQSTVILCLRPSRIVSTSATLPR